jgi:response regulator NasT
MNKRKEIKRIDGGQSVVSSPKTLKGSVVLVGDDDFGRQDLEYSLPGFGYSVLSILETFDTLKYSVSALDPAIVIVALYKPKDAVLNVLAEVNKAFRKPIVLFTKHDAPGVIEQSIRLGISAYVVDGIEPHRIDSIIRVAVARFYEQQRLRDELDETKSKLAERKVIEKAKGILMEQRGITESVAHGQLRKMAMDKGETLAGISNQVIDVFGLLQK